MAIPERASNAHARPPERLKLIFKQWQKATVAEVESTHDLTRTWEMCGVYHDVDDTLLASALREFGGTMSQTSSQKTYEVTSCPGLVVLPGLLSPAVQVGLLDRMLHRDLSNRHHLTNVHLFHHMQYPQETGAPRPDHSITERSFFDMDRTVQLAPKDPSAHKPMTVEQLLRRKLRWITLGGQYDWTNKIYPDEVPPPFPHDIARLVKGFFPNVDAQAAIVNLYTPGDILAMHRDVSEECDRGLVSISLGCDALFVVGNDDGTAHATIRLRSGDAVLMSGASRYAWHGVPKILPNTCPEHLANWPEQYPQWKGWMTTKRINLNVRQMREQEPFGDAQMS